MDLNAYLESRRLTYKEFAAMVDMHPNTIRNYAHGRRIPTLSAALTIEGATNGKVRIKDQMRGKNG